MSPLPRMTLLPTVANLSFSFIYFQTKRHFTCSILPLNLKCTSSVLIIQWPKSYMFFPLDILLPLCHLLVGHPKPLNSFFILVSNSVKKSHYFTLFHNDFPSTNKFTICPCISPTFHPDFLPSHFFLFFVYPNSSSFIVIDLIHSVITSFTLVSPWFPLVPLSSPLVPPFAAFHLLLSSPLPLYNFSPILADLFTSQGPLSPTSSASLAKQSLPWNIISGGEMCLCVYTACVYIQTWTKVLAHSPSIFKVANWKRLVVHLCQY